MALAHGVTVDALTLEGAAGPELVAHWRYAPALLSAGAVRELAERWFDALAALVRHVAQDGAGGRSPSDLPLVDLTQTEIEGLERAQPRLSDVLPLSPLQEGLLFHALYDARGPDVYTVQLDLELAGALDEALLRLAVRGLLDRHASLRASFRHEGVRRPVQVIVSRAEPSWRSVDLAGLAAAEREQRLAAELAAERGGRFELTEPPLLRVLLVRVGAERQEERHRLVLTHHHLLMDGWSGPVLVAELLRLYAAGGSDAGLPPAASYRDYLKYVARQDRGAALAYWRAVLSGVGDADAGGAGGGRGECCGGAGAGDGDARCGAERGAWRGGAAACGDAEHAAAGGMGLAAGTALRARRGFVRGDGCGPSGGACWDRAAGGASDQHAAAAG